MNYRMDEVSTKVRFRSNRYVLIKGAWFFSTREGHDVGPFPSKMEAHKGLNLFLEYMIQDPERGQLYAERVAERGLWESTLYH